MRVPAGGGTESVLLEEISPFWWSVANTGIYFISSAQEFDAIDRYDFSNGRVSRVGRLAAPAGIFGGQMTVSPDGRWALVTQQRGHSELMVWKILSYEAAATKRLPKKPQAARNSRGAALSNKRLRWRRMRRLAPLILP
jgi:hypothetical protein